MNLLKKIPFFLLLLPVFFCVHGAVENFGVIYFVEVFRVWLYICMALGLLFFLLLLITKNKQRAALITFYSGVLYLFFGALQDWITRKPWLSFFSRYSVLLSVLLISIIVLAWLLKKKETFRQRLFLYMNVLLILYCALDAILLLRKSIIFSKAHTSQIIFDAQKVKARPNVYYLLFDGYPGYESLQSQFGFKNDSLYDFLHEKGFTVLPGFSNYNFTIYSMSSIFNMQYVPDNYNHDHQLRDQHDFVNRFNEIKNADVFSIYKNMGYRIENYSIFDIGPKPCINAAVSFLPVHTKVLTAKMLHKRLIRHVGWWFNGTRLQQALTFKEPMFLADSVNMQVSRLIQQTLVNKMEQPMFCYAHLVMPHTPYFRDSTGALVKRSGNPPPDITDNRYFLPYVKYTNTVIKSLVNDIVLKDATAIVVVMSDHGFRNYEHSKGYYAPAFNNICAVRLPYNSSVSTPATTTGVNFFRYLFNSQYGQQIPYVKDSTIWINY